MLRSISSEAVTAVAPRLTLSAWRRRLGARAAQFGAHRMASTALLIRLVGAAIAFLSQPLLARWMGSEQFGIYAYVWTWVLLFGSFIDFGFAANAQRFIPEYRKTRAFDLLRGFLLGSRLLVVALSTALAVIGCVIVWSVTPFLGAVLVLPLYLACMTLPLYGLIMVQDGMARSYDWMNVALLPLYIIRPLAILALMGGAHLLGLPATAKTAMIASVIATWATALLQLVVINRRLAAKVQTGQHQYDWRRWVSTSMPIFLVGSFFFLLTYTDILVLQQYRSSEDVAIYYAATKIVSLIAFIYFSVSAAVAHRFAELHIDGVRERLATFVATCVRWTFWPSLAATAVILLFGHWILWLFGPEFPSGYLLLAALAVGLLARASVGPVERLLNMVGEQKVCAAIYAAAFVFNLAACLLLVPRYGGMGAAASTSAALVFESAMLFWITRRKLGLNSFICSAGPAAALPPVL